jgi:hypothetical protein
MMGSFFNCPKCDITFGEYNCMEIQYNSTIIETTTLGEVCEVECNGKSPCCSSIEDQAFEDDDGKKISRQIHNN